MSASKVTTGQTTTAQVTRDLASGSVSPSFVERMWRAAGGPPGIHATGLRTWINLPVLIALLATFTWLVTVIRQQACLPGAGDPFTNFCYSDLGSIHSTLGDGLVYRDVPIDQPVLSGYLAQLIQFVAGAFGASSDDTGATIFVAVATAVLFVCFLTAVFALARITGRPTEALMLAVSPVVVMTGLINLDLFAVALTLVALVMWGRSNPVAAGVLLGLATASRTYPWVMLIVLLVLCLRGRRMPEWLNLLGGFLIAWALANLPVMVSNSAAWAQSLPDATEYGSIWLVLSQRGITVPEIDELGAVLFIVATIGLVALALLAPRRPQIGQLGYLVAFALFVTNADYRPQYALFLLVLMILARPRWREWVIFSAGEVVYVLAIWAYLGGLINNHDDSASTVYQLAVVLRIATQSWVAATVVRDIWRAPADPARLDTADSAGGVGDGRLSGDGDQREAPVAARAVAIKDPADGVLMNAPDAAWVLSWRSQLVPLPVLWRRFAHGEAEPGTPHLAPLMPAGESPGNAKTTVMVWLAGRGLIGLLAVLLIVTTGRTFFEIIYRWDTERFMTIGTFGYEAIDSTYRAFYPGWPMVLSLGARLGIPLEIWGVFLATAFSLVAALALAKLGGTWTVFGWIFAPMAVFTMVPYSEALFCAFAFWAWQRARSDHWWQAAILAGAASTVRVSGLFLIGALVVMAVVWSGIDWRGRLRRIAPLSISVLMLGAYTGYLYLITGSLSAWTDAQAEGWSREFTWPWTSVENTIAVLDPGGGYVSQPYIMIIFGLEVVAFATGFLVVGWCLRKRLWAEAAYVAIQLVAFSTSYWLQSVNRAILIWFPVFIMLAQLHLYRPKTTAGATVQQVFRIAWLVISPAMMIFWAYLYFTGEWAS